MLLLTMILGLKSWGTNSSWDMNLCWLSLMFEFFPELLPLRATCAWLVKLCIFIESAFGVLYYISGRRTMFVIPID